MYFAELLSLSLAVTLAIGRLLIGSTDAEKQTAVYRYRATFLFGLLIGLTAFIFIHKVSWWEIILQIITIIIGSFMGCLIISSRGGTLIENNFPSSLKTTEALLKWYDSCNINVAEENSLKRLFDLLMSIISLAILSPLFLLISLLIWWVNPGPILFVKESVGIHGHVFKQYKFRSMKLNSESNLRALPATAKDERLISLGKFLRGTHIDELPQLINILKGEMSLVGPRPLRALDTLAQKNILPSFIERVAVLPGIAGLSQVKIGYHISAAERLKLDQQYIKNRSFVFDLKLLFIAIYQTLMGWHFLR